MGLRGVASGFARASSGIWQGLAEAIDPPHQPRSSPAEPADEAPSEAADGPQSDTEPPAGSMLVPLDTWTRILEQVGNVHEAGQQLADARERAARAETENEFLRGQLADLKTRRSPSARTSSATARERVQGVGPGATTAPTDRTHVATATGRTVRRVRERASDWLNPGKS